ncbi:KEOPS complex subunit [Candidatus Bathyarchaeota archaeon CG_4_8_14_3_um_filter_42_8]|nr:KEOPS complex subunit Pcc1 [Candidatus Bathyarchaeota archaeon]PIX31771.1 MAG: KEOPS complex subunit [Candidatus Bathyarchaeota archaeon CG_4_8_14_3_um_filter_42_8]
MEAEIILDYDKAEIAEAVAKAVSPDNFKTPRGLSIKTTWRKEKVLTKIKCKRKLSTFIATIDDLLFCISTAEKTLRIAKKLK